MAVQREQDVHKLFAQVFIKIYEHAMESEDTCNQWSSGECTTFDDSLGKAILRFVWVEPSVLDDFDFVRTVTLVRSFSVGKRMTATLLCDILAHFTRIFRCSSSDTIHDSGKCTK